MNWKKKFQARSSPPCHRVIDVDIYKNTKKVQ